MQHTQLIYVFCVVCGPGAFHPSILSVQHVSAHVQGAWDSWEAIVLIWHVLLLLQNVLDLGREAQPSEPSVVARGACSSSQMALASHKEQ